jgi:hypothetical protein
LLWSHSAPQVLSVPKQTFCWMQPLHSLRHPKATSAAFAVQCLLLILEEYDTQIFIFTLIGLGL